MDVKTATEVVSNVVTSGAVVIGGIWAYFKFIRGRVFARRAELDVSPALERTAGSLYLLIKVTLTNTGLSRLPLNENLKVVRLSGITGQADSHPSAAEWERILSLPILKDHAWLEAQETVTDTVVYSLGRSDGMNARHTAYQVEAMAATPRRMITRRGLRWQSRAIVFLPPLDQVGSTVTPLNGPAKTV
jgi:hypothetical protein